MRIQHIISGTRILSITLSISSFALQSMSSEKKIIQDYFLAPDKSTRWFEEGTTSSERFTFVPLSDIKVHVLKSSLLLYPHVNQVDGYGTLFSTDGSVTYVTKSQEQILAGFSDGSVMVGKLGKKNERICYSGYVINFDRGNEKDHIHPAVTVCTLADEEDEIHSHPQKPALLVGFADGSLYICDREKKIFDGFANVIDGPVTHIVPGNIPNMWLVSGGKSVTTIQFFYDKNGKIDQHSRKFASNDIIVDLWPYQCGFLIEVCNGSGLLMPYSEKTFSKIKKCTFSPEQKKCLIRLIAKKEAGDKIKLKKSEKKHFESLPTVMQKMLNQ